MTEGHDHAAGDASETPADAVWFAELSETASPPGGTDPVRWRELVALLALIALCDITLYRGQGWTGYAVLFVGAPWLLLAGAVRPRFGPSVWIVGGLLLLLAIKLFWCGAAWLAALGFALLVAFAMSLAGMCPHVLEVGVYASQTVLAGYYGLIHYVRSGRGRVSPAIPRAAWLNITLPIGTCLVFAVLFILANPDLLTAFGERMERALRLLRGWIIDFSPDIGEMVFWLVALWISVGLLRPVIKRSLYEEASGGPFPEKGTIREPALLYSAYRNTLLTVIGLFALYLVFEFQTLWFREFPEGFYYAGYAHQGAAWLTVALALATAILSLVFRGGILRDPRLPQLRKLAWIWSLENLLLALAVLNRMNIYIDFNGLTRMRIVGIFGMSAVVAGFVLVLWKIAHNRDFVWLMRRHLWVLALTIYLFGLTPVDAIWVRYNVRRILAGDPAPSVQISVHPINSEGTLLLRPLLNCRDANIREGVRAMLAERHEDAEALASKRRTRGWTAFQMVDFFVLKRLRAASRDWREYGDLQKREAALERFHGYAYQWY